MKSVRFSDKRVVKKQSRLWKWIKRIVFFILLWLIFLEFNHFTMAIEALQQINADQANIINDLGHKVSNLQTNDVDIQSQIEALKVKINGIEQFQNIHNVTQPEIHTEPHTSVHKSSALHISNPVISSSGIITTTVMAAMAVLKGVSSLIPVLP